MPPTELLKQRSDASHDFALHTYRRIWSDWDWRHLGAQYELQAYSLAAFGGRMDEHTKIAACEVSREREKICALDLGLSWVCIRWLWICMVGCGLWRCGDFSIVVPAVVWDSFAGLLLPLEDSARSWLWEAVGAALSLSHSPSLLCVTVSCVVCPRKILLVWYPSCVRSV